MFIKLFCYFPLLFVVLTDGKNEGLRRMVEHAHGHWNGQVVPQLSNAGVEVDSIALGQRNVRFYRQCCLKH
jgi:hypothetical protein